MRSERSQGVNHCGFDAPKDFWGNALFLPRKNKEEAIRVEIDIGGISNSCSFPTTVPQLNDEVVSYLAIHQLVVCRMGVVGVLHEISETTFVETQASTDSSRIAQQ